MSGDGATEELARYAKMMHIEKKANARNCKEFRTISLICQASKIMLKVLKKKRIETKVEAINHLGEDQFGYLDFGEGEAREMQSV